MLTKVRDCVVEVKQPDSVKDGVKVELHIVV